MNINTLLWDFTEAIANDADIAAWAGIKYDRDHKVLVNIDTRDPPGESDCPYVVLYPASKSVGRNIAAKGHGFEVVCCIHDDESQVQPESNITEYKGVRRIEEFRKLVETAIAAVDTGNVTIETVEIEYDTIDSFPYMMAGMLIGLSETVLIGSDPLA